MLQKDLFYNWMAQKNKLGGQHKVPRLSNHRDLLEELMKKIIRKPPLEPAIQLWTIFARRNF